MSRATSELRITTGIVDGRAATSLLIDGIDVLESVRHPLTPGADGQRRGKPKQFYPVEPRRLLPPDSSTLLPAGMPSEVMVGVCGCREPGCGSLWLSLRRDANTVVWEPDCLTERDSIDRTWRFDLRQYLDAVDDGAHSVTTWETTSWELARELRRRRDSLFGLTLASSIFVGRVDVVDAAGRADSDDIDVCIADNGEVRWYQVPTTPEMTADELVAALLRLGPWERSGLPKVP